MPRKYIRKSNRAVWSEEDLQNAVNAITNMNMSIREAGRQFNIPERTLRRRITNNNFKKGGLGPSSYLGVETEKKIVAHIKQLQEAGFPPTRSVVTKMAYDLAKRLGLKQKFNPEHERAGSHWYKSFMERNPELSLRKAEGISAARAHGMNREEVNAYFDLLSEVLEVNNLLQKPGYIYNVDESGLQMNNKPGKVVALKGSKEVHLVTSGEKGETISVIVCCNAEGNFLPPYCIFKGVNKKAEFEDGMPPGSVVVMNRKSAYVTNDIFLDWLKNHFTPRKPPGKTLLLLDGHTSHMSVECLEFAVENDILFVCLPSHTTHYLQPLDRSFFKPLKTFYYQACDRWMRTNPSRKITRLKFGSLLHQAWSLAATASNAINGFRATGVFPLNANAVPEHAYAISDRQEEVPMDTAIVSNLNGTLSEDPQPSTSTADPQPTPRKVLNEISPVPVLQKKVIRRKQSGAHLTSPTFLKIKKQKSKHTKGPAKQKLKNSKSSKKQVFTSSSSSEEEVMLDSSNDESSDKNENECVECLELYENTTSTSDWIRCINCNRWLHETCSNHKDFCNSCGRYKQKKDTVKRVL